MSGIRHNTPETLEIIKTSPSDRVIALAGNPNVGKSTVFNHLTGLKQHTGNWPGKTVVNAQGLHRFRGNAYILVDLPGTYSIMAHSAEEEIARDFILYGGADATVVVCDATCLERNLNLVLQILEITPNVVVCVNLLDEAGKKNIAIDLRALEQELGVPVAGTSARGGKGLDGLMEKVEALCAGDIRPSPRKVRRDAETDAVGSNWLTAEDIASGVSARGEDGANGKDRRLDRILTSKLTGIPIMLALLCVVFWITVTGADYPSEALFAGLFWLGDRLTDVFRWLGTPEWVHGLLVMGVYRVLAWVVAVMLPPMAIFFPLFTLLEDFGYLPRVAFNLDHHFKKAKACGKQALTMCMGNLCCKKRLRSASFYMDSWKSKQDKLKLKECLLCAPAKPSPVP